MSQLNKQENLQEQKFLEELTPEELENIKGGFAQVPTLDLKAIIPATIGILILPPTDLKYEHD